MHSRSETSDGRWRKMNYEAENTTEINQICSPQYGTNPTYTTSAISQKYLIFTYITLFK